MSGVFAWVKDIAFFSVLQVVVLHMLPSGEQKKYVRFFMGLLFLLVIFSPILRWSGQEEGFTKMFLEASLEQEVRSFEQQRQQLETELEQYTREQLENAQREADTEEAGEEETGGKSEGRSAGELVAPVEIRVE